jgi:NADH dehydrogenase
VTTRGTVLVTGANGFVGRHVVRALVPRAGTVRAMVRSEKGAAALAGIDCELVRADVTEPETLRTAVAGCDGVVHLVAVIAGRGSAFDRVIAQGARNLLDAARAAGVGRWVQMSALGTSRETKDLVPYYGAKWAAEEAVRSSGFDYAIVRPSFVFGPDGGLVSRLARIARLAPVTPIVGPGTQRLQPIWVDDVAEILARCATGEQSGLLEVGGPDVVSWNELWTRLKGALGTRRPDVHLPFWLVRPQAVLLERLPNPPVTRDQLTMLEGDDNVADPNDALRFGLPLVPLDDQLRLAVDA